MEVLTSLLTILIIVLLGMLSRKTGIFKAEHAKTLSSFVYYFGLPTLFFVKLSTLKLLDLEFQLVLGTLLPTMILLIVLLGIKTLKLINKDTYILLSLSISFGSYAFFGVAFFETFLGGKWLANSILSASLLGVLGIITTLSLLEYANEKKQGRGFLGKIFTNPLILSILIGAAASLVGFQLDFLSKAFLLVGQTSSAIAIFVLGMFIYDRFSVAIIKDVFLLSIFRMIGLPLVTFLVIRFVLPGSSGINQFLLLENGMPAAISLVVFAERYEYKITETAGIVSLTSIFSFVGLTVIYYLSQLI
ncbi:MAG: AEC family transporter [Anaerolineales bacterium]|nr:AEC family transporter [Anaerolineales bacterium]